MYHHLYEFSMIVCADRILDWEQATNPLCRSNEHLTKRVDMRLRLYLNYQVYDSVRLPSKTGSPYRSLQVP